MNLKVTLTIEELLAKLQLDNLNPDEVVVTQNQDHDGDVLIELRNCTPE